MSNWSIIDKVYLYDSTIEGLLSVVYKCLKEKSIPQTIQAEENYIGNLVDETFVIQTNYEHSSYLVDSIVSMISELTLYYVFTAFLSGNKNKSDVILRYLIYAFKHGKNINWMKDISWVIEIQRLCRYVKGEAHRLTGFLRFKQLSNKFLYAEYESEGDILEFLAEHFAERLKKEIWMIHDKGRKRIALYDCKTYIIVDSSNIDLSVAEEALTDQYLILWKEYFNNISIKERENRRCQMHFMPKKYWKYLPEV